MNAQEANGEQREKNGGKFAETDDFGRAVLKRKPPETAPTLGKRAKKSQPIRVGISHYGLASIKPKQIHLNNQISFATFFDASSPVCSPVIPFIG